MPYAAFRKVPAKPRTARHDRLEHLPILAPTKGWVSAVNLAAVPAGYAYTLENIFPTSTGIRVRSGNQKEGTCGADPVESLIAYIGGATRKMFAAMNGSIFDMTAPADPDVAPSADVTGQTSDYYSHLNFATAGGNYLTIVNGTDAAQQYDGSSWSVPSITGVSSATLNHIWAYRNRQWFIEKNTMRAWYLGVDAISGAALSVSLAGVFQKGGYLVLGATWSTSDTGNSLDDRIVFISSEGEYAVYQGGNPGDAATWSLVGLYEGAKPLGRNQFGTMKAGADLLILTESGIIPMSAIVQKDPAALSLSAVTKAIEPDWVAEARSRRSLPWEIIKWPSRQYALVNCPVTGTSTPAISFVVNLETGAWCKYTGWDTRCLVLHDDGLYFGTNAGTLQQAEVTGADDGELYYSTCIWHADHLKAPGYVKTVRQARATFRTRNDFTPRLSLSTDYVIDLPAPPSAANPSGSSGEWDVGLWDVALWDAGSEYYTVSTMWVSIGKTGYSHAAQLQITNGAPAAPTAELILMELTYERGALVV